MKAGSILLVEDNKMVLEVAKYVLQKQGYNVLISENLNNALKTLDNLESLDLLFTDVLLPDGKMGTEVAQAAWRKMPSLPVLFTSGFSANEMTKELLQKEQVLFLPKPYKPKQMIDAIEELLER
jgi:DNA-binding NtrC family response regulator